MPPSAHLPLSLCLVFASIALFGCVSGPPKDAFPARDLVQQLVAEVPPSVETERRFSAKTWKLTGPLPSQAGYGAPTSARTRLHQLFAAGLNGKDVKITQAEECTARELAQVVAKGGAFPGQRLDRFIRGACGSVNSTGGVRTLVGEIDESHTDDEVIKTWSDDIKALADSAITPGSAGIAVLRHEGKLHIVVSYSRRLVDVEPFSLVPNHEGQVVIRGQVLAPTETVQPMINHGLYGYQRCQLDPQVRAPKFVLTCTPKRSDDSAWLTMATYAPGRMVGQSTLQVLTRPAGTSPLSFGAHAYAPPTPRPPNNAGFAQSFVKILNHVRSKAEAKPLHVAPAQSETAQKLARHLVHAHATHDEDRTEQVMLGLLAGWDIEAQLVDGSVAWTVHPGKSDLAEILGSALVWPSGRQALLNPSYDLLALGTSPAGEHQRTMLVGSWETFQSHSIRDDSKAAYKALKAARKRFKRPTGIMPLINKRAAELAQQIDEGGLANDAMDSLLQEAVAVYQNGMAAWVLYPRTLEDIVWPPELLNTSEVFVSMVVAVERHPDIAWSRRIVLVVAHFPRGHAVAAAAEAKAPPALRIQTAQR